MARLLRYRAGYRAVRRLRERGLDLADVRAVFGPASGPKWLVLVGIDRALMESGLLQRDDARRLLVGASAGAWRMLALACRDPLKKHRALLEAYTGHVFTQGETPATISRTYREMLTELFADEQVRLADHPFCDLAVHVARTRGLTNSSGRGAQMAVLALAAVGNLLVSHGAEAVFEPVLLHSAPQRLPTVVDCRVKRLQPDSVVPAALATGSVPLYFEPAEIPGLELGVFLDGGMTDYGLRRAYIEPDSGVLLFPHFRRRIVPGWFDKHLPWRRPPAEAVADVLQLHPSQEFVAQLPDGRLPDRDDFLRFMDTPRERQRRWQQAVGLSEELGRELLDDIAAGRIPDLVEEI